jgi:DnaK suppressor protein
MDQSKTKTYEQKLEKERAGLLEELKKDQKPEDFGSDVDGLDEETDEAEELGNQLAVNQVLKDRIEEINEALEKIQAGKYGLCEKCGGKISEDVLDAIPSSRLCKTCKGKK